MEYKKEINKIEQFLKTEFYREAGRTCGELLESALRDLVTDLKTKVKSGDMMNIIENEKKIGGDGKSHNDFGLGQLVGLFREAKLFNLYERIYSKKIKYSKSILHNHSLIELRNNLTHNSNYKPSLDELEYFFSNVKTFLNELGFLKVILQTNKSVEFRKTTLICSNCGTQIETEWEICPQCLYPLKLKCDNCGNNIKANWKVCPYCKNKLISLEKERNIEAVKKNNTSKKEYVKYKVVLQRLKRDFEFDRLKKFLMKIDKIKDYHTLDQIRLVPYLIYSTPTTISVFDSLARAEKLKRALNKHGGESIIEEFDGQCKYRVILAGKDSSKDLKEIQRILSSYGCDSKEISLGWHDLKTFKDSKEAEKLKIDLEKEGLRIKIWPE